MIIEEFNIVKITNGYAFLQATKNSGCGGCGANKTCGVGILGKYFGSYLIKQPLQEGQKIGDKINLSISERELFYRAFQLYIMPILMLFVGAYISDTLYPQQDITQILFGFLGFISTFLVLKYLHKTKI